MKKVLLSAMAAMFALAAVAQNKAIEALAEKYADAEGFTVVNLNDGIVQGLATMIPQGEGTFKLDDGTELILSELFKNIMSVTAIIHKGINERFALETKLSTAKQNYSTLVAHNSDDVTAKVLYKDLKRGKYKGNKEIVVTVIANGITVAGRVIGRIDAELLAKLAEEVRKRG